MNKVCDLSDLYNNPELVRGCRFSSTLDPEDPAYTIAVFRTMTPPPPFNDVAVAKAGLEALRTKVATDATNTLIVLAAIDQALADEVASVLGEVLDLPMKVTVTVTEKEEEPS